MSKAKIKKNMPNLKGAELNKGLQTKGIKSLIQTFDPVVFSDAKSTIKRLQLAYENRTGLFSPKLKGKSLLKYRSEATFLSHVIAATQKLNLDNTTGVATLERARIYYELCELIKIYLAGKLSNKVNEETEAIFYEFHNMNEDSAIYGYNLKESLINIYLSKFHRRVDTKDKKSNLSVENSKKNLKSALNVWLIQNNFYFPVDSVFTEKESNAIYKRDQTLYFEMIHKLSKELHESIIELTKDHWLIKKPSGLQQPNQISSNILEGYFNDIVELTKKEKLSGYKPIKNSILTHSL